MDQEAVSNSNQEDRSSESSRTHTGGQVESREVGNSEASVSPQDKGQSDAKDSKKKSSKGSRVSFASPRLWHGMRFLTFMRLLWNGGFRIHFLGIGMAVAVVFYSLGNSVLSFIQWLFLGRKLRNTKIEKPPVFIVGHWRSGTTLVHELMSLDEHLTAPNTYQCFAPCHFLITELTMKPVFGLAMPKTRPMDNMATGMDRPNEDEFAICGLGGPSTYAGMAFPNNQLKPYQNQIDMKNVSDEDLEKLEECLQYFANALTYKYNGQRLLLKSPTHTGRVEFLRKMFPGAKFLHISRDPRDIIPSTIRLWKRLDSVNGFQIPNYDESELANHVGETFRRMYDAYLSATNDSDDDVVSISYEEVVANPVESLKRAYQELGLDDFESLEPRLRDYMQAQAEYQRNQYQLNDGLRNLINENCEAYQQMYGYDRA